MTEPAPWLDPAKVADWLAIHNPTQVDSDRLELVCAGVSDVVERARPDCWLPVLDPDPPAVVGELFVPDSSTELGAIMLAAHVYVRRNTPAGMAEGFGDSVAYVATFDPDVDLLLRTGRHRLPRVG